MKNCEKCFQSGESWSNCAFTAAQSDPAPMAGAATGAFAAAARVVALPTRESPTVATKSRRFSVMAGHSLDEAVDDWGVFCAFSSYWRNCTSTMWRPTLYDSLRESPQSVT